MKCAVAFSVLLAGCSVLLGDSPNPPPSPRAASSTLLEDLVRMTRAGSSDASVLGYARARRAELPAEVSDASLRWLRASGVSERVVRYMSAIDVRVSAGETPEGVTYAGETEGVDRRRAYSSVDERDGNVAQRHADRDTGHSYGEGDAYAGYESDYGYDSGYGYRNDPYFGYPYLYSPFPSYVIVDRARSFRGFPHRDHRDHRDHGSRGSWRDRGSGGRRGGPTAAGPPGAGRPSFASGFAPGARGHAVGPRGFGPPRSARGNFSPGFGGPRRGIGEMRESRNPALSRGAPPRSGGGFSRGSIATSAGGRGRR